MAVILVFGEPIFQDDRGDVLKPERPCVGCALRLVGSDVLGSAAKGIWDGWATGCCGCANCLPYSRSDHEWIICAAQILEIIGPQLDQIRNKVLEDEVHEVKWKRPWQLHRADEAKDGHTFHSVFLGEAFGFCVGRSLLYLSPHLDNFIMPTKRQVRWIILCDCGFCGSVNYIRVSSSVKRNVMSGSA